jgi:hypothetical protein
MLLIHIGDPLTMHMLFTGFTLNIQGTGKGFCLL